jgi:phage gp29-like protein
MNLLKFFRKPRETKEIAPQLTVWDRRSAEIPGPPNGALPYPTYDQMERDSMVQTALTVKKLGVLAAEYHIEPSGDPERDRFVEQVFEQMEGSPATVLEAAMDAFSKGWSVQELVFFERKGRLWLEAVRPKDPSLFGLNLDTFGRLKGLHLEVPGDSPRELPIGKFVVYRNRGGYGRPKGRSDLDAAYRHWQAKTTLLDAWKLFLSKFAMPTMLAKCGPSVSSVDRGDLVNALADLQRRLAVAVPSDVDVSPINAAGDGSTAFMDAIDFHNREIARSILGQTLTTDEGRRVGSLAMGKVHLQVLTLQLEAIRKELADVVMTEQIIRPLVELNFGPGAIPRFAFERVPLTAFTTGQV